MESQYDKRSLIKSRGDKGMISAGQESGRRRVENIKEAA